MRIFMWQAASDASLFNALVFGYFYCNMRLNEMMPATLFRGQDL
jgi:hypothetical protein